MGKKISGGRGGQAERAGERSRLHKEGQGHPRQRQRRQGAAGLADSAAGQGGWKAGPNRTFVCLQVHSAAGQEGTGWPAQAAAHVGEAGVQGSCRSRGNRVKERRKGEKSEVTGGPRWQAQPGRRKGAARRDSGFWILKWEN